MPGRWQDTRVSVQPPTQLAVWTPEIAAAMKARMAFPSHSSYEHLWSYDAATPRSDRSIPQRLPRTFLQHDAIADGDAGVLHLQAPHSCSGQSIRRPRRRTTVLLILSDTESPPSAGLHPKLGCTCRQRHSAERWHSPALSWQPASGGSEPAGDEDTGRDSGGASEKSKGTLN